MTRAGLVLAVAALGITLPGCGGGDSGSSADASSADVAVRDFDFAPREHAVQAGERVTWENTGEEIHNVRGRGFFSRAMDPGQKYSFAFRKPGTYRYLCTLHPGMKGTVVVR